MRLPVIDNPGGNVPEATDQVYGETPPVAASNTLYGTDTVPLGTLVVMTVSTGSGWMVKERVPELAVTARESVTVTTTEYGPELVGVPETTPTLLTVTPVGHAPEDKLHAYGGVPPEADSVRGP